MKMQKVCLICLLIIGPAKFVAGANPEEIDCPEHVRLSNWIKISETAGMVVNNRSGEKVVGTLYGQTRRQMD
jgi:hypothetical protein